MTGNDERGSICVTYRSVSTSMLGIHAPLGDFVGPHYRVFCHFHRSIMMPILPTHIEEDHS